MWALVCRNACLPIASGFGKLCGSPANPHSSEKWPLKCSRVFVCGCDAVFLLYVKNYLLGCCRDSGIIPSDDRRFCSVDTASL